MAFLHDPVLHIDKLGKRLLPSCVATLGKWMQRRLGLVAHSLNYSYRRYNIGLPLSALFKTHRVRSLRKNRKSEITKLLVLRYRLKGHLPFLLLGRTCNPFYMAESSPLPCLEFLIKCRNSVVGIESLRCFCRKRPN